MSGMALYDIDLAMDDLGLAFHSCCYMTNSWVGSFELSNHSKGLF